MHKDQQEDFKVQREHLAQNIRRQNRETQFNKRRNCQIAIQQQLSSSGLQISPDKPSKILIVDQQRRQILEGFIREKYFPHMFPDLVKLFYSNDVIQKHHGAIGIRKILSNNQTPPIHLVFEHNILPQIIEYTKQTAYPHLKLQSTWMISNIATGNSNQVAELLSFNVIPLLNSFLLQNQIGIADQAIWAIGNLAGDSPSIRDQILDRDGLDAVIHFINNTTLKSNLIQAAWALSNLCRGNPLPSYNKIEKAVPLLCKLIGLNILDQENLSDCLWALSYCVQGPKNRMNILLQSGVLPKIIEYSQNSLLSIASPALRILGAISTGNESQTQQLIDNNILQVFQSLLDSTKAFVRRQVCWVLSNIAAGTYSQVNLLINNQKIINSLLNLFEYDSSEVKRQICYVFANMSFLGDKDKLKQLFISKEVLRYYGDCTMQITNPKLIESCLDTLPLLFDFGEKMRQSPEDVNFVISNFLNYPGVHSNFERLHLLESQKIYDKALRIYEKYFDIQSPETVSGMIPQN